MFLTIIVVIAAFGSAVSLVSGVIAIYDRLKSRTIPPEIRKVLIVSVVISVLFLTLFFAILSLSPPSQFSINTNTQPTVIPTFAPTQLPTPIPTSIPSTPTSIPPPQCTNQNGAPPNGVEATELMINCMLPSGLVALIVVCNEAHLLQPFDTQVQGPGVISYQNPAAGSSSISIEAQNSALANASCPAKFLIVSPTQVDGQVAQEVIRLKNLIGNNAGVTYMKAVGENVTKTSY